MGTNTFLHIDPYRVLRLLLGITAFFMVMGVLVPITRYEVVIQDIGPTQRLFDVDNETSITTSYSGFLLISASLLVWLIAHLKKQHQGGYLWHWRILAVAFLYIAIDESAMIHESAMPHLNMAYDFGGIFHLSWVVIGLPLVIIFGLAYLKFLWHLPMRSRGLFILSGALYVGGALGMEMLDGWYQDLNGRDFVYAMLTWVEESCEMLGVVCFIYSLLDYLDHSQLGRMYVRIAAPLAEPVSVLNTTVSAPDTV